jgi:hypothetical protein
MPIKDTIDEGLPDDAIDMPDIEIVLVDDDEDDEQAADPGTVESPQPTA